MKIAGVYAVVGFGWIAASDAAVESWFGAAAVTTVQTYKGWGFIALTALLVFLLSSRALRAQAGATSALAASEARLRTYLQQAPMAVFVLDTSGRCLEANLRAAELVGCSLDNVKGLSVADVVPRDQTDEARAGEAMAQLGTQGWVEGDFQLKRRDGPVIWVTVRAVRLENNEVLAFAFDSTERRTASEKLRQAATVYASSREGVVITDAEAKIIAANPAFTSITGYSEAEVLGQDPSFLKSGVQDRDWYRDMWRSIRDAGYWQGELWNRRKNGDVYPEWLSISAVKNDAGETTGYVGVFTDITRIKHSEAQLDHLAHTDALTGLPNRLLLTSRLEHALERAAHAGTTVALFCVNLDHFKPINDSLGFDIGDEALRAAAERLDQAIAPGDTLARLGADEFIIVREDLSRIDPVADLARDIVNLFATPLTVAGHSIHVSASIGISLYPADGTTPNALIQQAGSAVTHAKTAGGRTFAFHTPSMADSARARFTLEAELRRAIERREFVLFYQPRVRLADGSIEGVEALIRWRRPDGSLRDPDGFIPAAEAVGLIDALGDWVLTEACRQLRAWIDDGRRRVMMAVNVSPHQLRDPRFAARVTSILAGAAVEPSWIELEITETAILAAGGDAEAQLRQLAAQGVRVAIDDFGTGHSSLARLRFLPAHTLKIDRSFVQHSTTDTGSKGLVASVIALAGHLNMGTVAEGVETEDQAALVRQLGCPLAQGYLFGRPMPADELGARLPR